LPITSCISSERGHNRELDFHLRPYKPFASQLRTMGTIDSLKTKAHIITYSSIRVQFLSDSFSK
jgi:hypothetical protein